MLVQNGESLQVTVSAQSDATKVSTSVETKLAAAGATKDAGRVRLGAGMLWV